MIHGFWHARPDDDRRAAGDGTDMRPMYCIDLMKRSTVLDIVRPLSAACDIVIARISPPYIYSASNDKQIQYCTQLNFTVNMDDLSRGPAKK